MIDDGSWAVHDGGSTWLWWWSMVQCSLVGTVCFNGPTNQQLFTRLFTSLMVNASKKPLTSHKSTQFPTKIMINAKGYFVLLSRPKCYFYIDWAEKYAWQSKWPCLRTLHFGLDITVYQCRIGIPPTTIWGWPLKMWTVPISWKSWTPLPPTAAQPFRTRFLSKLCLRDIAWTGKSSSNWPSSIWFVYTDKRWYP